MHRRSLIAALACWPVAALRAEEARPHYKVSAGQLSAGLAARFPRRLGIPGLAELELASPALLLLPGRNRAGASLRAKALGSGLGPLPPGRVDLVFALRYEEADRTIRAFQPELSRLDWPGLDARAQREIEVLVTQVAAELSTELVLHKFTAQELALPDSMGFAPERLLVEDDGVTLEFRPKRGL